MKALMFIMWLTVDGGLFGGVTNQVFEVVEFDSMKTCQQAVSKVTGKDVTELNLDNGPDRWRVFCVVK